MYVYLLGVDSENLSFLSAFAKLKKSTTSFVTSVCQSFRPCFRMEQLCYHWTDFYEIWYLCISQNCRKNYSFIKYL